MVAFSFRDPFIFDLRFLVFDFLLTFYFSFSICHFPFVIFHYFHLSFFYFSFLSVVRRQVVTAYFGLRYSDERRANQPLRLMNIQNKP